MTFTAIRNGARMIKNEYLEYKCYAVKIIEKPNSSYYYIYLYTWRFLVKIVFMAEILHRDEGGSCLEAELSSIQTPHMVSSASPGVITKQRARDFYKWPKVFICLEYWLLQSLPHFVSCNLMIKNSVL